ncbi:MAG TPA: DUF5134 domain-containing protein [Pseudonocardiaceae bacterium]|nr:DUF5134 domain-containing protein [Pseudonocardiaceae bacterium]
MGGAEWVRWAFAAMFAALTVYYVIRLFVSDPGTSTGQGGCDRGVDVSRGVMSLGMVVMLVPWIDPLPRLCWQLLFGLAAGYIAVRLIRRTLPATVLSPAGPMAGHHELHLLVGGVAMVYMFAVMPAGPDLRLPQDPGAGVPQDMADHMDMVQAGFSGLGLSLLTWTFVGYFVVFVVRLAARLAVPVNTLAGMAAGAALPGGGPRGVVVSPHLLGSTEVVMGIGMSYMLLTML